jgi:hypothetical protein
VVNFEPVNTPSAGGSVIGHEGAIYFDITPGIREFRFHDSNMWRPFHRMGTFSVSPVYTVAQDSAERTTTSSSYTSQDNLVCSITAEKGDLVMVQLEGWFMNSEFLCYVGAYIDETTNNASLVGN